MARRNGGRPTKLTPEVKDRICTAILGGNYYEAACAYAGITYQTFVNWMDAGEKAKSGKFFEFFVAVRKAEADAEVRIVTQWQAQIPDNWQAARDFLARRYGKRWAPTEKITLDIQRKSDDELRAIVAGAIGADGGGGPGIAETEAADPPALPDPNQTADG